MSNEEFFPREVSPLRRSRQRTSLAGVAEAVTARYLELRGATIRRRNFRGIGFEVDLIVEWQGCLVGVEVKLRRRAARDLAADESLGIDARKLARIRRGMSIFSTDSDFAHLRVDVALIDIKKNGTLGMGAYYIDVR